MTPSLDYSYTQNNQLECPCTYMYSAFGGSVFLTSYRQSRLAIIASLARFKAQDESGQDQQLLARWRGELERLAVGASIKNLPQEISVDLVGFNLTQKVSTVELLDAMLECQPAQEGWSQWLARIVQRFEVSKKLYKSYLPGFRKGEGGYEDVANYLKLALLLTHGFADSGSLVCLNSLLKVNDLMFSALESTRWSRPALELLSLLAKAELHFVAQLGAERGVSIA